MLAFPVGLPALYLFMLYPHRSELYENTEVSKKFLHLRFFFAEYKPQFYFWEVVECLRKCLLMGFAVFFKPGTLLQLIVVIILVMIYIVLLTHFKPYTSWRDNQLSVMNQMMLFLTLVGASATLVLAIIRISLCRSVH